MTRAAEAAGHPVRLRDGDFEAYAVARAEAFLARPRDERARAELLAALMMPTHVAGLDSAPQLFLTMLYPDAEELRAQEALVERASLQLEARLDGAPDAE